MPTMFSSCKATLIQGFQEKQRKLNDPGPSCRRRVAAGGAQHVGTCTGRGLRNPISGWAALPSSLEGFHHHSDLRPPCLCEEEKVEEEDLDSDRGGQDDGQRHPERAPAAARRRIEVVRHSRHN
jgi:hypothetical protein